VADGLPGLGGYASEGQGGQTHQIEEGAGAPTLELVEQQDLDLEALLGELKKAPIPGGKGLDVDGCHPCHLAKCGPSI
jgi:hypothetical protein